MSTNDELYAELKPDIEAVAGPLFEFSMECLRKRGLYKEDTAGERREPLLSVRQAATLLGLCTATVYEYCAKGNLRHVKVASAIRIAGSALQEFVETRSLPREPERPQVVSLPQASSYGGADENSDSVGTCPANDELSACHELPDEDSWYDPE